MGVGEGAALERDAAELAVEDVNASVVEIGGEEELGVVAHADRAALVDGAGAGIVYGEDRVGIDVWIPAGDRAVLGDEDVEAGRALAAAADRKCLGVVCRDAGGVGFGIAGCGRDGDVGRRGRAGAIICDRESALGRRHPPWAGCAVGDAPTVDEVGVGARSRQGVVGHEIGLHVKGGGGQHRALFQSLDEVGCAAAPTDEIPHGEVVPWV